MKATGLAGGAFTFAMLNDHHAYAASETPMTSEIASNSETVANQNSTTVTKSETSTTEYISSQTSTPKMLHLVQIQQKKYFIIYNR